MLLIAQLYSIELIKKKKKKIARKYIRGVLYLDYDIFLSLFTVFK